jgi:hypothetical protein
MNRGHMKNITEYLDRIATQIEKKDPKIALAIDKVSDKIDKVSYKTTNQRKLEQIENEKKLEYQKKLEDPLVSGLFNKIKTIPKVTLCELIDKDNLEVQTRNKYLLKIYVHNLPDSVITLHSPKEDLNKRINLGPESRYFKEDSQYTYGDIEKIVKVVEYVTKL